MLRVSTCKKMQLIVYLCALWVGIALGSLPLSALQTKAYRVTVNFQLQNTGYNLNKLILVLPLPQTNMYQTVKNLQYGNGEFFHVADGTDLFVRYVITSGLPGRGATRTLATVSYDVILREINRPVDGDVPNIAYDPNDADVIAYTRPNLPYINPHESRIRSLSDSLWLEARQVPLTYARKAYEYVASHYRYRNPNTGIHPLVDVLNAGGGDCGNLSSIYISLLRAKGIPARHLVAYSVDDNFHAWAEFMLQGFGWVPVDVTYKLSNPQGNFFGRNPFNDKYIIQNTDLNLGIERQPGEGYTAPLLQSYLWWVWGSGDLGNLKPQFSITSQIINTSDNGSSATIKTVKVTHPKGGKTVKVVIGGIYVYGMLDQEVAFVCSLLQNNKVIKGTRLQAAAGALRWDPGYWGENAYSFDYDLEKIRRLNRGAAGPVYVKVSVVDSQTNKVLGTKRTTLSLRIKTKPALKQKGK